VKIADLEKLGFLPLQHHEAQVDVDLRAVPLAARYKGLDPYNRQKLEDVGDLTGGLHWGLSALSQRGGLGAWSFAMPAVVVSTSQQPKPTGGTQTDATRTDATRTRTTTLANGVTLTGNFYTLDGTKPREPGAAPAGGGGVGVLPAADREWNPDRRFAEKQIGTDSYPKGTRGVVLCAMKEGEQHELFLPSVKDSIVAVNKAGDPAHATLVHDLKPDDSLDMSRRARLHSMMRVVLPVPGGIGGFVPSPEGGSLALQLGVAGRDGVSGHGLVYDLGGYGALSEVSKPPPPPEPAPEPLDPNATRTRAEQDAYDDLMQRINNGTGNNSALNTIVKRRYPEQAGPTQTRNPGPTITRDPPTPTLACLSARQFGPIEVGNGPCQHQLGTTKDGEAINSAHISTNAYFYANKVLDGPAQFTGELYPYPTPKPNYSRVILGWDPADTHPWKGGARGGKWKWWAESSTDIEDGWPEPPPHLPPPPGGSQTRGYIDPERGVVRSFPLSVLPWKEGTRTVLTTGPTYDMMLAAAGQAQKARQAYAAFIPLSVNASPMPPQQYVTSGLPLASDQYVIHAKDSRPLNRRADGPLLSRPQVFALTGYGNEAESGGWKRQATAPARMAGGVDQCVQGGVMVAAPGYTLAQAQNDEFPTCGRHTYITFAKNAARLAFGRPGENGEVQSGSFKYASESGHEITQMVDDTGADAGFHAHYQEQGYAAFDASGNVIFATAHGSTVGVLTVPEKASTTTPPSGYGDYYFKTDGLPYAKNDAGTEMPLYNAATGGGMAKDYIQGFRIAGGGNLSVYVYAGRCRGKLDAADIEITQDRTPDITGTANGASGYERKTLTGTIGKTSGSSAIVGTGTAFLSEFAPGGAARALVNYGAGAPTISSAGTTVTGTNTYFLRDVAVNDLIGTAAKGFYRVTAIASETSLTIVSAPASAFASDTASVIEGANLLIASGTFASTRPAAKVNTITSNTALTIADTGGATTSGITAYCGINAGDVCGPGTGTVLADNGRCWLHLWVATDGTNSEMFWSTQRTKPLGTTSYTTDYRRIASYPHTGYDGDDGAGLNGFVHYRGSTGDARRHAIWWNNNSSLTRVLTNGSATTPTAVRCDLYAPPFAPAVEARIYVFQPTVANTFIYVTPRTDVSSAAATPRAALFSVGTTEYVEHVYMIPCDGAQYLNYVLSVALSDGAYVDVTGYEDDTTR
jgi:hypothetical protein